MPETATTATTPRAVWVVNDSGHDFSPAERFGTVSTITRGTQNIFAVDRISNSIARIIATCVESEHDYLLLSGAPLLNALCLYFWLKRFGRCNVLQWSATREDYEAKTIKAPHLDALLKKANTKNGREAHEDT